MFFFSQVDCLVNLIRAHKRFRYKQTNMQTGKVFQVTLHLELSIKTIFACRFGIFYFSFLKKILYQTI